jgi:hypothetical protein
MKNFFSFENIFLPLNLGLNLTGQSILFMSLDVYVWAFKKIRKKFARQIIKDLFGD